MKQWNKWKNRWSGLKQWQKRSTAAVLALALLAAPTALASEALGHDLHTGTAPLSSGSSVTKGYFWSDTYDDLRTEHYITYMPNQTVRPTVSYGKTILSRETLTEMARDLEAQGKRVVGGTNGDFYVMATGEPLGMVITDGVLRSSSSYFYGIGFRADGTAFIGQPNLKITANLNGTPVPVTGGLNKVRQVQNANGGGLTLYSSDFGPNTQNNAPGVDVILRPVPVNVGELVSYSASSEATYSASSEVLSRNAAAPGAEETVHTASSGELLRNAPGQSHEEIRAGEEMPPPEWWLEEMGTLPDGVQTPEPSEPAVSEAPAGDAPVTSGDGVGFEPAPAPDVAPLDASPVAALQANGVPDGLYYSDLPRVGSRMRFTVDQVLNTNSATPIPEGCMVLSMNGADSQYTLSLLQQLRPGDEVTIDITSPDPRWNEAVEGLGAMYHILENGQLPAELDKQRTARTAIGIRPDGSVIFYTLDGKQPGHSVGGNFRQVALRLQELGCVDAVGLDGGGSTTLGVTYPGQDQMEVISSPANGKERPNSTSIFLTTTQGPTGVPHALDLNPNDAVVMVNGQLSLTADVLDTAFYPVGPSQSAVYQAEGAGTVTQEGLFIAGPVPGRAVVTAAQPDGISGTAQITVVDKPDGFSVRSQETGEEISTLYLAPGQQYDLTATATWHNMPLTSADESYSWSCDPAIGTIAPNGLFTAGTMSGSGKIYVSAGDRSAEVSVNLVGHILPLMDMEGELSVFTDLAGTAHGAERELGHVRMGRQSLRVDYNTQQNGLAKLGVNLPFEAGEQFLGLWLYGDGTGNNVIASFADAQGNELLSPVAGMTFSGWQHRMVPIPRGSVAFTGLQIVYGGGEAMRGSIWLDHLITSNESEPDRTAPTVTVTADGPHIKAAIRDDRNGAIREQDVRLTCDGKPVSFIWDGESAALAAELPAVGAGIHRITVTAADVSGNLGRGTLEVGEASESPFDDMGGHWAGTYVTYLYDQQVTKGSYDGAALNFHPDAEITRGEFFTMVARWLGLNPDAYAQVELPFRDTDQIPDWALPALRAMYAEGFVSGSQRSDGLYADPGSSISRAEVMTVLGRTQSKGWAEADLSVFADGSQVAEWSAPYVRALVSQNVIGGFGDGTLRPAATMSRGEVAKVLTVLR